MAKVTVSGVLTPLGVGQSGEVVIEAQVSVRVPEGEKIAGQLVRFSRVRSDNGKRVDSLVVVLGKDGEVSSGTPEGGGKIGEVVVDLGKVSPVAQTGQHHFFGFEVRVPPKRTGREQQSLVLENVTAGTAEKERRLGAINQLFVPAKAHNTTAATVVRLAPQEVPRLSVSLNEAQPDPVQLPAAVKGDPDKAAVHDVAAIAAIAHHVFARLDDPVGLLRAWEHASSVHPEFQVTTSVQGANEMWARKVTEMLLGTPYGRPSSPYKHGVDHDYCAQNIQKGASSPFYGLSFACEHLASFGSASRGVASFPEHIEAGARAAAAWTKASPAGKWFTGEKDPKEASGASSGNPVDLPPVQNGQPVIDGPKKKNTIRVEGLFKIASPEAEFGPGAVLLFSNRPAHPNQQKEFEAALPSTTSTTGTSVSGACSVGTHERCVVNGKSGPTVTGPFRVLTNQIENGRPLLADHTAGAHIGFVLRVSADRKKIQTFDTGGLSVPDRLSGLSLFPGNGEEHGGNFDDPLTATVASQQAEPYRGVGVLPRTTEDDAQKIVDHVKNVLNQARPLGLARFALIETGKKLSYPGAIKFREGWLKFMSPLVPMYQADKEKNYHISRFLWSLREMPGKGVTGMWFLYIPQGALAKAMIRDKERQSDLKTLFDDAGIGPQDLGKFTLPIVDCASRSDGKAEILGNRYNNANVMHRLHFLDGRFGNETRLRMDQAFLLGPGDLSQFPSFMVPPGTSLVDDKLGL